MPSTDAASAVRSLSGFFDDWLAFQRWYRQVPALAVGIAVGDEVVFTAAHGVTDLDRRTPATPATRFRIASHSKLFTATAIMQLVEDGQLRLDDRVADHLDWFAVDDGDSELVHVTVRQLLSHSSGLTRDGDTTHWFDDNFPSLDDIVAQVGTMPVYATAEHLKYSNVGFTIAGQLIEAATGRSYEDHVTDAILAPLGLSSTTPDLPDDLNEHAMGYPRWLPDRERPPYDHVRANVMNSATGFSSTVDDLLRWYGAHRFGSGELLHDRSKREMQRPQFEGEDMRWGLGFSIDKVAEMQFVSHGGGYPGFITYSGLEQQHGLTIVVLTNAADGPARNLFAGIAAMCAKAIKGDFDGDVEFDADAADELAGFYEHRWAISQVARIGSKMVTADPSLLDPTMALLVLEHDRDHDHDWSFRYPTTIPMASPGELVRFEPGDPPTVRGPSSPPVPRNDSLLGE
ncbi:MAG: serine hydrolase domain-containing protein [Actinomycetota bacterium]